MVRTFLNDGVAFTPSEFIVGKITAVGELTTGTYPNYPCSWQSYTFSDDLASFDTASEGELYGDHTKDYNTAYPINQTAPNVDDWVLLRTRGQLENDNVYEFISMGAGGSPSSCCAVTAVQCSAGILTVTYSDGCTTT